MRGTELFGCLGLRNDARNGWRHRRRRVMQRVLCLCDDVAQGVARQVHRHPIHVRRVLGHTDFGAWGGLDAFGLGRTPHSLP